MYILDLSWFLELSAGRRATSVQLFQIRFIGRSLITLGYINITIQPKFIDWCRRRFGNLDQTFQRNELAV